MSPWTKEQSSAYSFIAWSILCLVTKDHSICLTTNRIVDKYEQISINTFTTMGSTGGPHYTLTRKFIRKTLSFAFFLTGDEGRSLTVPVYKNQFLIHLNWSSSSSLELNWCCLMEEFITHIFTSSSFKERKFSSRELEPVTSSNELGTGFYKLELSQS